MYRWCVDRIAAREGSARLHGRGLQEAMSPRPVLVGQLGKQPRQSHRGDGRPSAVGFLLAGCWLRGAITSDQEPFVAGAVLAVVLAASPERRSFRVAAVSDRFSTATQDSCLGHTWVAQFAGTRPAILKSHRSSGQMPRSKQSVLCAQTLADASIRGSSHRDLLRCAANESEDRGHPPTAMRDLQMRSRRCHVR